MISEPLHIVNDGLRVTVEDCDAEFAVLSIEADVRNEQLGVHSGWVKIKIKDVDGTVAAERSAKFTVLSHGSVAVRQRMMIANPKLWNVDTLLKNWQMDAQCR